MLSEKGALKDTPAIKLLLTIFEQGLTGVLYIKRQDILKVLYFSRGKLIWAISNSDVDKLENILISKKLASPDDIFKIKKEARVSDSIGKLLVEKGIITLEELIESSKEQLKLIIISVFKWKDGGFNFVQDAPPERLLSLDLDITQFVVDYILEEVDVNDIWREVGNLKVELVRNPDDKKLERYNLSEKQKELLNIFDGKKKLDSILSRYAEGHRDSLLKIIYFFLMAELLLKKEFDLSELAEFDEDKLLEQFEARAIKDDDIKPVEEIGPEEAPAADDVIDQMPIDHEPIGHENVSLEPLDHEQVNHEHDDLEPVDHEQIRYDPITLEPINQEPVGHEHEDLEQVDHEAVHYDPATYEPVNHEAIAHEPDVLEPNEQIDGIDLGMPEKPDLEPDYSNAIDEEVVEKAEETLIEEQDTEDQDIIEEDGADSSAPIPDEQVVPLYVTEVEALDKKKRLKYFNVILILVILILVMGGIILWLLPWMEGTEQLKNAVEVSSKKQNQDISNIKEKTTPANEKITEKKGVETKPGANKTAVTKKEDSPGKKEDKPKKTIKPKTNDQAVKTIKQDSVSILSGKSAREYFQEGSLITAGDVWKRELIKSAVKYSILLELDCMKSSVIGAYEKLTSKKDFFILNRKKGNKTCFLVMWGKFYTYDQAASAINSIPQYFWQQKNPPKILELAPYL